MASHSEDYIEAGDGLKLFYREFGADNGGLPILCLAGLTRNSRDFEDVCARLGERHRVLALDLRGRGFSDWDPNWRNYNPETTRTTFSYCWISSASIESSCWVPRLAD